MTPAPDGSPRASLIVTKTLGGALTASQAKRHLRDPAFLFPDLDAPLVRAVSYEYLELRRLTLGVDPRRAEALGAMSVSVHVPVNRMLADLDDS